MSSNQTKPPPKHGTHHFPLGRGWKQQPHVKGAGLRHWLPDWHQGMWALNKQHKAEMELPSASRKSNDWHPHAPLVIFLILLFIHCFSWRNRRDGVTVFLSTGSCSALCVGTIWSLLLHCNTGLIFSAKHAAGDSEVHTKNDEIHCWSKWWSKWQGVPAKSYPLMSHVCCIQLQNLYSPLDQKKKTKKNWSDESVLVFYFHLLYRLACPG